MIGMLPLQLCCGGRRPIDIDPPMFRQDKEVVNPPLQRLTHTAADGEGGGAEVRSASLTPRGQVDCRWAILRPISAAISPLSHSAPNGSLAISRPSRSTISE